MLLGYARVSTADQNPLHQVDALRRAGVLEDNMFGVPRSTVYGHLDKARIGVRPAVSTAAPEVA